MSESDVFLKENRVSVVGGDGKEVENGREQGDLEVTVGRGEDPSVTLNADRANVTLGGGAGAAPEGDVKLLDRGGTNRVQISAEAGNRPDPQDNRIWIDGGSGNVQLAAPGSPSPDVSMDASSANITVGRDGSAGSVHVTDDGGDPGTRIGPESIVVNDDFTVGNVLIPGLSSSISMEPVGTGIDLYTSQRGFQNPNTNLSPAGNAVLYDGYENKGVVIQGGSATMKLGYAYSGSGNIGQAPTGRGKSGSIVLDDGNIIAGFNASTQFTLRAEGGTLEVLSGGDVVFEIDPNRGDSAPGRVRIPSDWEFAKDL